MAWGVLYPPHFLSEEALHEEIFMRLSPYHDDAWQNYFLVSQDNYEMFSALGKDQLIFEVVLRHECLEKNNAIPLLLVHFVTRK